MVINIPMSIISLTYCKIVASAVSAPQSYFTQFNGCINDFIQDYSIYCGIAMKVPHICTKPLMDKMINVQIKFEQKRDFLIQRICLWQLLSFTISTNNYKSWNIFGIKLRLYVSDKQGIHCHALYIYIYIYIYWIGKEWHVFSWEIR